MLAGVGSSIKKVETLAGMVKKKMTGLFQVIPLLISFSHPTTPFCEDFAMNIKMQVNKIGERIVREYWDPKSEDLVSIFCINVKSIGQDETFNSIHLKPMILGFRDPARAWVV